MSLQAMKSILITGAGARVGSHLAQGLAAQGWAVAIHYNRSRKGADALAQTIRNSGGTAELVQANLFVPQDVNSLIERAAGALGQPLTALINNASTFDDDSALDFTNATFDYHMDINLRTPVILSQQFAKQLPERAKGVIINMVDQRVLNPDPSYFTYSLSKSALYAATKTLAQALAPHIRVNAIGPGPTLQNKAQTQEEFAAEAASTLLGHGSSPDDILEAAHYLLSAESVTGQMLTVDSGQHLA